MRSGITRRILSWFVAVVAMAASIVVVPLLSSPAHAEGDGKRISRGEVIARAHMWIVDNPPYDQGGSHPDPEGHHYRTDCSGFVSMAWKLGSDHQRNTSGIETITSGLASRKDLKPGDVLLKLSGEAHVVLFEKWTNDAHTRANFIAEANHDDDMNWYKDVDVSNWDSSYHPRRYDNIFDDTYDAANEQAPRPTDGAKCRVSKPGNDGTIDIGDRQDVYIEVKACVKRETGPAGDSDTYHAWLTLTWGPGRNGDDSHDTSKDAFDGFLVHTQLQHENATAKEVYCYFDNNLNGAVSGSRTCHTQLNSTDDGDWQADGFLNWNLNGDGKFWLKPWYATGTGVV